jgi:trans-aconitate methyltransferase
MYGEELIALLSPVAGDKILDLGCGDGFLAEKIAKMGCDVTGVDSSQAQVNASKRRGVSTFVGNGECLGVMGEFDGVLSNAALHWMPEPGKVIANIWHNIKPGGVFVGEMGAEGNVSTVVRTLYSLLKARGYSGELYNPWYFPSEDEYKALLVAQGFKIHTVFSFSRPTKIEGDLVSWLRIFAQSFMTPIAREEQESFYKEVQEELRPCLYSDENGWVVDYVRLRFKAYRANS